MECQVTNICKSASYHLRQIGVINHVITDSSLTQLVHSMISSSLNYCNALLNGIPDGQIKRLQKLPNNDARIICKIKKYDFKTCTLQQLHWLLIMSMIQFKTLALTYKSLNGKGPAYISELLTPYFPGLSL